MLQPILGDTYWYFIWNLPRLKASKRESEESYICALPVRDCNLVFRLDRISHQLRVQFRIRKGNYNVVVDELRRGEEQIIDMRALLVGKWIKDTIHDIDTWLLIVAVEINTENVVSIKKRYSSKKQEIFGAKVILQLYFEIHRLFFSNHYRPYFYRPLRLQFPNLIYETRYHLGSN
jgi:hypothetical protein